MNSKSKGMAVLTAAGATIGVFAGLVFFTRRANASAPTSTPQTPSRPPVTVTLPPLQEPPLVNLNDPARDRVVTQVLNAQLNALNAAPRETVLIRATAYLDSKGSNVPISQLPTQADVLYWAAMKVDQEVYHRWYAARA